MENLTTFYYRYLRYMQSKDDTTATPYDKFLALSYAVRARMVDRWIETQKSYHNSNPRRVYFLSMEYIFGKSLKQNIINLSLEKSASEAAESLGFSLEELYSQEEDFELGNAGRARLAACMMDSMSTLGIPAMAYGLCYDYGLFKQHLKNGIQNEKPNDWLHTGHPWEIKRPEYSCKIGFNGVIKSGDYLGLQTWCPDDTVMAVPYDFPVPGFQNNIVNHVRLWTAQASNEFLPDYHNHRDYMRACEDKFYSYRITNYLFPEEDVHRATEIRIKQQYFFVSASIQDIIRRFKLHNTNILDLDKKVSIHMNGSRCAIAIVELMRILVDLERVSWSEAWRMTKNIFSYTSHAINFDNLEKWPVYLIEQIIPRHLKIIFDINQHHLDSIKNRGNYKESVIRDLSIIEEGEVKWVKMANLAALGSTYVCGVSLLQTELLEKRVFTSLSSSVPVIIKNKTNGISLRRWLLAANRPLSSLITELIGDSWITNCEQLAGLSQFIDDQEVLMRLDDIKHTAKRHLAAYLATHCNISIDAESMMDINCKKVHPAKRHFLHILYILNQYLRLRRGEDIGVYRTHIFAGKASPSDFLAKQVIHLIHIISTLINNDPLAFKKIRVVFIPDYGISLAERVIPAADLSEQISNPFLESCGTTNMKFAINGAVTIASKGGSNIEIAEKIGLDNMFLFGQHARDYTSIKTYSPASILENNQSLKKIFQYLDQILPNFPEGNLVYPLISSIRDSDSHFVLLDFQDYITKQEDINNAYLNKKHWHSMCLHSIAQGGWFSIDRLVKEYASEVWKVSKL